MTTSKTCLWVKIRTYGSPCYTLGDPFSFSCYTLLMVDREKLDEIILKNDTNDWWQPALFIKNTRQLLPAELEILKNPPPEDENYNCFIYILGFAENKELLKETNGFIYDTFVKKLIEVGELTKSTEPQDGDYVVYQDLENYPDNLTHIGILDGDHVVSKWAWGPLIKHSLWDVPKEYGETVFYLKAMSASKALGLYEKYKMFNVNHHETLS